MKQLSLSQHSVRDLDNEDRVRVLGIIDQFRELGVNNDISIPQSSGKSSLLEGLTGLGFPIASDLCTRHATQIVLRRSRDGTKTVKISIIPGPSSSSDEAQRARLLAFSKEIPDDDLTVDMFATILDEAAHCMGLPSSFGVDFETQLKRFSDDVLKIELSGPEHHHLSVVDVPGLFHNPTPTQTQEDLDIVRALVGDYMCDRRTIILAVMDGTNNLANQEVFKVARAADPPGKRTVGIITKLDALASGDERGTLSVANNEVEVLTHGWFCVRNRTTREIQDGVTLQQRNQNEKQFFSTAPWSTLPKDRTGIVALRKFLGKLLYDHIRGEYPALVQEIRGLVLKHRSELEALGVPRQTAGQQRQFLFDIAARYQHTVVDCLRGGYQAQWKAKDARKLRMHLHLLNEGYAKKMTDHGHTWAFRNPDNSWDEQYGQDTGEEENDIYLWIRQRYQESRGAELPGSVNPTILEGLFREQIASWESFSMEHIRDVYERVCEFNARIWRDVVPDVLIREKIEFHNGHSERQAMLNAEEQLKLLLFDETQSILQTVNDYFAAEVQDARMSRVEARLRDVGMAEEGESNITLEKVMAAAHLSNEDQAVYDIHDSLKAYYRIALKRFVDNVVLQCVERCFVGSGGPVKHISSTFVSSLDDAELERMAAESFSTSMARSETSQKLARLERALALAERERL